MVVVFWSFACEASLLRLRQLEDLADQVGDDLVILAVHTPRFPFEESVEQLQQALLQERIPFRCVHDPDYVTWNRYNPEGWPSTVVVDPRGRVLGAAGGTADIDAVASAVMLGLQRIQAGDDRPNLPRRRRPSIADRELSFPRDVAVRPDGQLVVADTGNDRLLLFDLGPDRRTASVTAEIDGLDRPVAVAADGDRLFVAEQGTGAVSMLDLAARERRLLTDQFVRPASLAVDADGSLVVADAGAEKLYRIIVHSPETVTVGLIAGVGVTGARDGAAAEAELAQPCGLARTEAGLVFCDSASSNLRLLTDAGRVATITGNGFFDWGLVDGPAHKALLQRPSDLAVLGDGSIVVVDTGNGRLRRLANRRLRTLGLSGLQRPSAVAALARGELLVADTGNHRLVLLAEDLQTAWPLTLRGVLPPRTRDELTPAHP